jgi:hypothetical protein
MHLQCMLAKRLGNTQEMRAMATHVTTSPPMEPPPAMMKTGTEPECLENQPLHACMYAIDVASDPGT